MPAPQRRQEPQVDRVDPVCSSLDDLDESTVDDSLYGRDPFDVVAALEEELGHPIFNA